MYIGSLGDGKQVATYGKLWQMRMLQRRANLQQTHPGAIFLPMNIYIYIQDLINKYIYIYITAR